MPVCMCKSHAFAFFACFRDLGCVTLRENSHAAASIADQSGKSVLDATKLFHLGPLRLAPLKLAALVIDQRESNLLPVQAMMNSDGKASASTAWHVRLISAHFSRTSSAECAFFITTLRTDEEPSLMLSLCDR